MRRSPPLSVPRLRLFGAIAAYSFGRRGTAQTIRGALFPSAFLTLFLYLSNLYLVLVMTIAKQSGSNGNHGKGGR